LHSADTQSSQTNIHHVQRALSFSSFFGKNKKWKFKLEKLIQDVDPKPRSLNPKTGTLGRKITQRERERERERERKKEILPCESVCGVVEGWDLQQFVVCVIYSSDLIRRKWHCLSWQRKKKEMERMCCSKRQ
jgi:hypothetical protein